MNEQSGNRNWRSNLLVTGGVILTVMMALLMSQIDLLQVQLQPTPAIVSALQSTPDADTDPTTDSKLTEVSLSTATRTPAPTATMAGTAKTTAVPMLISCGAVPEEWTVYTVHVNDTLLSLSAYAGTTVAAIAKANCIQNEIVFESMIIYLPVRPPTPIPCGPPSWWVRYVVQPGDTLSNLAAHTGTTVYAIMQANCLDSTYLTAGRTIYLSSYPYTRPTATPILWTPTPTLPIATITAVSTITPTPIATIIATSTPTNTPDPSPIPTATTDVTLTPEVTLSPTPIDTATTQPPTDTPAPTATPELPTATAVPPTNTPVPPPTDTPIPLPTATP